MHFMAAAIFRLSIGPYVSNSAAHLHHQLCSQAGPAGGRDELDAHEFSLHAGDGAGFARGCSRGVNGLVFRVDVRHGALQDNTYGRGRGAENRLPAHGSAAVRQAREAGERKLTARSVGSGKCLIVKTEPHVSRKEGDRRSHVLIRRHFGSYFAAAWVSSRLRTHGCDDPATRLESLGSTGFSLCRCSLGEFCNRAEAAPKKQKAPIRSGRTFLQEQVYHTIKICQEKFSLFLKIS